MKKDFLFFRMLVHFVALIFVFNSFLTYLFPILEIMGVDFNCVSTAITSPECGNTLVEWALGVSGSNIMLRVYTLGLGLILDFITIIYLVNVFNYFKKNKV